MVENRDDGPEVPEDESVEEISIDLNRLFSRNDKDLNRLFPDAHFRELLRDVKKTQRDVERFLNRLENDASVPKDRGGRDEVS